MNYFAHLLTARHARPLTPAEGLGTVLPDLLPHGVLDLSRLAPDVLAGRALHHRADHAFHGHRRFQALDHALRAQLSASGLPPGAARACAHVGTELLLDGTIEASDVVAPWRAALAEAHLVHVALSPVASAQWEITVGWATRTRPADLAEPTAVAERLFRILGRRPRLAFDPKAVGAVADALADHLPQIVRYGPELLVDTSEALRAEQRAAP